MTATETGRIKVTNMERTLIDIAVRPAYTGGAKDELLSQMLDDLDYDRDFRDRLAIAEQNALFDEFAQRIEAWMIADSTVLPGDVFNQAFLKTGIRAEPEHGVLPV